MGILRSIRDYDNPVLQRLKAMDRARSERVIADYEKKLMMKPVNKDKKVRHAN